MNDTELMKKALDLAAKGRGHVAPNPLVGAVIVKDGKIVGEGYHQKYGEAHAEINAINQAGENCTGATLYVTLEPCAHHGQTPPCVEAVIKAGFKRVIIATADPNPETDGRGISKLMDAGIEVDVGLLEDNPRKHNEVFFKYTTPGRPGVIIKAAQTIDSKIADERGHSHWITGEESRRFVHRLRSHVDAIMIGGRTAVVDNPQLNVRHIEGEDPYRIILHGGDILLEDLGIFAKNDDGKTIIAAPPDIAKKHPHYKNATVWEIDAYEDGHLNLAKLLMKAGREKISSILVEGGGHLFSSLLKRKFVDKVFVAIAPKILGAGVNAFEDMAIDTLEHSVELDDLEVKRFGKDIWLCGYPIWR